MVSRKNSVVISAALVIETEGDNMKNRNDIIVTTGDLKRDYELLLKTKTDSYEFLMNEGYDSLKKTIIDDIKEG